jgi:hypothetical protein
VGGSSIVSGPALRPAEGTRPRTIATLKVFTRSPRYEVRVEVNSLDGNRYVSLCGFMLATNGRWVGGRRVNIRASEIDDLIVALEDASEVIATRRAS